MLAVSPLRNNATNGHDHQLHHHLQKEEMESFLANDTDFPDFCDGNNLLDSIDFDDLFLGIQEGDILPDLEMDPELLAEFSLTSTGDESDCTVNTPGEKFSEGDYSRKEMVLEGDKSDNNFESSPVNSRGEEVVSKMGGSEVVNPTRKEAANAGKGKRWTGQSKNNAQGKRKVKVDWTPELHRRFVQAVEQLGVDKAVPSRILELMGIDCLTRHNIASHLQKHRSHRKHLLAREAEAASWSQRRQMYGRVPVVAAAGGGGGGGRKRDASPWLAPAAPATLGFPPVTPAVPHFRPLHVWGHPTMDQSWMNMWQKHHHPPSAAPPMPPPAWPPAVPPHHHLPPESPYWHPNQRVANVPTPGTPCFTSPLPPTRLGAPPVPGIPPHAMYKGQPCSFGHPNGPSSLGPHPLDLHPSKESVDAAIGDVLSKPWLPLPLGLKPPSVEGVMGELHRHGVSKISPSCA